VSFGKKNFDLETLHELLTHHSGFFEALAFHLKIKMAHEFIGWSVVSNNRNGRGRVERKSYRVSVRHHLSRIYQIDRQENGHWLLA